MRQTTKPIMPPAVVAGDEASPPAAELAAEPWSQSAPLKPAAQRQATLKRSAAPLPEHTCALAPSRQTLASIIQASPNVGTEATPPLKVMPLP